MPGFTTIENYTSLKPGIMLLVWFSGFTTIENYTSLKLTIFKDQFDVGFTTIENYTSLKRLAQYTEVKVVFHRGEYLVRPISAHGFLILQSRPRQMLCW